MITSTKNVTLACIIKSNSTNGSTRNCGLQISMCKFQLMSTLLCHMIATKQHKKQLSKVTSQDGNLTGGSGNNGCLEHSNCEFQLINTLLWNTIAIITTQPTTTKFTSQGGSK